MMKHFGVKFFVFIMLFTCFTLPQASSQQDSNTLSLKKKADLNRIVVIVPDSYFTIKPIHGKKIKGKFSAIGEDFISSTECDTVLFRDILWIKAKKQIKNGQKAVAVAALFSGLYFSLGTIPAAFMIIAMDGNALIFLAPAVTISAAIIGFRTLKGRKYKMNKWVLFTQKLEHPIHQ